MKFHKKAGDGSNAQNKIQLFPMLLINFIGALGFSVVFPYLLFLVKDFGGNAIVFGILSYLQHILLFSLLGLRIFE
jgi:DHA1 family tetracycline resistance protein-like MFS transporter